MGWNNLIKTKDSNLFTGIKDEYFYFLHSYYFELDDEEMSLSKSNYHIDFTSSVSNGNIYAVQFHPEKSHLAGIRLLENFSRI